MLLKNAKLIIKDNEYEIKDVLIVDGKISRIDDVIDVVDDVVINLKNKLVMPGMIDAHVHLREPGYTDKETIETGTLAAAKGGFTTIMVMPNIVPYPDNVDTIKEYLQLLKDKSHVNTYPYACITKQEHGKELVDIKEINKLGIIGYSDDGVGVANEEMMKSACELVNDCGSIIVAHTEDMNYRKKEACMHDGIRNKELGLVGIPSECEWKQFERDLKIVEKINNRYHICHMSCTESVNLLKEYKDKGLNVSGEVTTHHLLLSENDVIDESFKMNPPLRSENDRQNLIRGLKNGVIDIIANDHAPHTLEEKSRGMVKSPFGIVSLETSLALLYTKLVKENIFTLEELIKFTCSNPAKLFNLNNKGHIKEGYDADLIVIDEETVKVIDSNTFVSKGKNTPFNGIECVGWNIMTILDGKVIFKEEI